MQPGGELRWLVGPLRRSEGAALNTGMEAVPVHLREANEFVVKYHRHSLPTVGGKFALGAGGQRWPPATRPPDRGRISTI